MSSTHYFDPTSGSPTFNPLPALGEINVKQQTLEGLLETVSVRTADAPATATVANSATHARDEIVVAMDEAVAALANLSA